jgi:hypothetical protein
VLGKLIRSPGALAPNCALDNPRTRNHLGARSTSTATQIPDTSQAFDCRAKDHQERDDAETFTANGGPQNRERQPDSEFHAGQANASPTFGLPRENPPKRLHFAPG